MSQFSLPENTQGSSRSDMPPCVYKKHGAYYYVKNNRWLRLSEDKTEALKAYANIASDPYYIAPKEGIDKEVIRLFAGWRQNAKTRGHDFFITREDVLSKLREQRYLCAVSSMPFSLARHKNEKTKRRPYAPSVDRINSNIGYSVDNIRVVCVCVNLAMQDWGDEVITRMAVYSVRKMLASGTLQDGPRLSIS